VFGVSFVDGCKAHLAPTPSLPSVLSSHRLLKEKEAAAYSSVNIWKEPTSVYAPQPNSFFHLLRKMERKIEKEGNLKRKSIPWNTIPTTEMESILKRIWKRKWKERDEGGDSMRKCFNPGSGLMRG